MFCKEFSPSYIELFKPRYGHRAVNIDDSNVLIIGGGNNEFVTEASIFNIENNQCQNIQIKEIKNDFEFVSIDDLMNGEENKADDDNNFKGLASFGMEWMDEENHALIFGGMEPGKKFSNKLYRLDNLCELKLLHQSGCIPDPRIGHSFTKVNSNMIILFGGLKNVSDDENVCMPKFSNDTFILHINNNNYIWEKITYYTIKPPPRESHSAVLHDNMIVVFGGSDGINRLDDLWFFNISTMKWSLIESFGSKLGRSMHSANIFNDVMYVFGGFIQNEFSNTIADKTTNILQTFNLLKCKWSQKNCRTRPEARAGHACVQKDGRLYVFSGRNDFVSYTNFDCFRDLWFIDLRKPEKVYEVELVSLTTHSLEIKWKRSKIATCYCVEIKERVLNVDAFPMLIKSEREEFGECSSSQVIVKKIRSEPMDVQEQISNPDIVISEMEIGDMKFEQLDGIGTESKIEGNESTDSETETKKMRGTWCMVGIYKDNYCTIKSYIAYKVNRANLSSINIPNLSDMKHIMLAPGRLYYIRISAMNSCGLSKFSNIVSFRTECETKETSEDSIYDVRVECHIFFFFISWKTSLTNVLFKVAIEEVLESGRANRIPIHRGTEPSCKFLSKILSQTDDNFIIHFDVYPYDDSPFEVNVHYKNGEIINQ